MIYYCTADKFDMTNIFKLCVVVLCALGYLVEAERVEIRKNVIANAWQSSAYDNYCFNDSVENFGHWNYFHTQWSPDSSGYHWLLLKLKRKTRLLSVTVHGRPEAPVRAHNIEVLHSDKLPDGMNTNANCLATIPHILNGFVVCGRTRSDSFSFMHEVKCNTFLCSQYILLRRFVHHETDRYMNFADLHIEQVPKKMTFHECSSGSGKVICNAEGLKSIVPGENSKKTIPIKVCLPCKEIIKLSDCALRFPAEVMKVANISQAPVMLEGRLIPNATHSSCLLIADSKLDIAKHDWRIHCRITLTGGKILEGTETVGFIVSPKKMELNVTSADINGQKFWVNGRNAYFSFTTDFAFPKPVHKCWLIDALWKPQPVIQEQILMPKYCQNETHRNGFYVKITSVFAIHVNSSIEDKRIFCRYELQGDKADATKTERIPNILYPCKTNISISSPISWKHGSMQTLTVDSSAYNPLQTSHTCFLEAAQRNSSLDAISSTSRSSTFLVNVTRHWGKNASVLCLVNQSGIFETWNRQQLPSVLYRAEGLKIKLHVLDMRSDAETNFTVEFLDAGNPAAEFRCSISGRNISAAVRPASLNTFPPWRFKPLSSDDKQIISCQIDQVLGGHTVFNETVDSSKLNVIYKSRNLWTAVNQKQSRPVMEGQLLMFEVTSVGGNPEPSHRCWLNRSLVSIYMTTVAKNATHLKSRFSLNSTRKMNGDKVVCRVTQKDQPDMSEEFSQVFTVFYKAKSLKIVDLPSSVYESTNFTFYVRSQKGNPNVTRNCSVENGGIFTITNGLTEEEHQTTINYIPDKRDTTMQCSAVQYDGSHVVFNQSTLHYISVLYASKNSMIISPQHPVMEGSTVNVTLVSSDGRPAVSSFECYIGDTELSLVDTMRTSNATHAIHVYSLNTTRAHNQMLLKGKFKQDEKLISWHITSLTVYFHPIIDLSALSFNGSHILGSISVTQSKQSLVSVSCFFVSMPSSEVVMSQTWNFQELTNSMELSLNSTPVADEHRGLVKIFCHAKQRKTSHVIVQVRTLSSGTMRHHGKKLLDSQFSMITVGISAVSLAAIGALLVLIRQCMGCSCNGGNSVTGGSLEKTKSLAAKRRESPKIELEVKDHYIC